MRPIMISIIMVSVNKMLMGCAVFQMSRMDTTAVQTFVNSAFKKPIGKFKRKAGPLLNTSGEKIS